MIKINDLVVVAISTAILTLGLAAAQARDVRPASAPAAVTAEAPAASEARTEIGKATAEKIVEGAPCAKKIKVVYAGYGEANRACASR